MEFAEWLLSEERSLVDLGVLNSYERAFQQQLGNLIGRTQNPELRQTFQDMQHCPVRNRSGRCSRFIDCIVGALIRHGCHQQYDLEDSIQRIVFRMLSSVGESGRSKESVFDIDPNRTYDLTRGNPLQARFLIYLQNELRSICGGNIPALRKTQRAGMVPIGSGDSGTVSADEIPGRQENEDPEMINDITELLRRKSTPDMPLADLFQSILRGEGTRAQRNRFGWTKADEGRKLIVQTIQDYARKTQNSTLLRSLDRFRDFHGNKPDPSRKPAPPPKPPKPTYPPDEQDYRSICQVLERIGRSASLAVFGSQRSRWLERGPRDPNSPHPNRLADVLARMLWDGVLVKRGARYLPGPNYARYLDTPAAAVAYA